MDDELKEYGVFISHNAKKELNEIHKYIKFSLLSEQAANDLLLDLHDAITSLKYMPYRGFVGVGKYRKYRQIIVKKFTIIYEITDGDKVVVVTVKYAPSNYGGE